MGDKLFIYLLSNIGCKIFFIYKSCAWKQIPTNHHQNVIQINKIQKKIIQSILHFWKKNMINHVRDWKYLIKNQLKFFPFRKISMKYERLKLMFVHCLKSSIG